MAIKILNVSKLKGPASPAGSPRSEVLYNEINVLKYIMEKPHDNIVKCYDIVESHNIIYIIMEYCGGGDISACFEGKQIKLTYAKYYFKQLLNSIEYLHENKIVHRDLKPQNILLDSKKKLLKLCDFGFAKHINGMKKVLTTCGSPLYMAPEIFKHTGYTDQVDVWAMGIIFFEMIYGYNPLRGCETYKELSDKIISNDIECRESLNIDDAGRVILSRMLERNDIDRISLRELTHHEYFDVDLLIDFTEDLIYFNGMGQDRSDVSTSDVSTSDVSTSDVSTSVSKKTNYDDEDCEIFCID
jgi:5'-AMP-activated protein kinase catalytic alpha subunit